MTMDSALATLRQYELVGIENKGRNLGRGAHAVVLEMNYHGLQCAGKQLYEVLYGNHRKGGMLSRFAKECRLLSQLRHPNIVQFLGVHFTQSSVVDVPILVMEFLPSTLTQRIDKNAELGSLPDEVIYSILSDVALGLNYLHGHCSTIHRDLSANNILLTKDLTAKISDLGVAKILNLNPHEMSTLTKAPGTVCYMPPEALADKPQYNTSIDIFSYGIILIHVFSGNWPFPTQAVIVDPNDSMKLIPVSEAKRRQKYFDDITPNHPLMDLILSCISNNPTCRPTAAKILQDVKDVEAQFAPTGKEELLQRVKALSLSLETVEKRSKEVTSISCSTSAPKSSRSEHEGHERVVDCPPTSTSKRKSQKKDPLHDALVSMQKRHTRLGVSLRTALENIDRIKEVQLSMEKLCDKLENSKMGCQELVATIEKRRQDVESLIADLKNDEERGEMQALKFQEALNTAQELCRSLQHFLQVQEETSERFQKAQQRLGELMHEAFQ